MKVQIRGNSPDYTLRALRVSVVSIIVYFKLADSAKGTVTFLLTQKSGQSLDFRLDRGLEIGTIPPLDNGRMP
jgi:hypothetical protein